ncbi:MAG: ribulose-phosphate 3-epimerase [Verrucomicrobia bacterium]|nr:ribulose-phosphate 3-epimerase [Verrucomicrobiota bacterium]
MIIAPSLLAADYTRLAHEVRRVAKAGADWLHVDIMDGHFVPNLTFGPGIVAAVRKVTRLPLDVHLMCSRPEILLEPFARAGASVITVHVELGDRVEPLLWKLRALGTKVGLAVNPPTPITHARRFLPQIDLLLVMTVNPGFGGQSFIHETVPKIQQAAAWRRAEQLDFRLEVDGGITFETVGECARAGADTFVSGTGLFGQRSLRAAVTKLRRLAARSAEAGARPAAPIPLAG